MSFAQRFGDSLAFYFFVCVCVPAMLLVLANQNQAFISKLELFPPDDAKFAFMKMLKNSIDGFGTTLWRTTLSTKLVRATSL